MKLYLILISGFLFLSNDIFHQAQNEKIVQKLFAEWNQNTLAFIGLQAKRAIYPERRLAFEKRAKVMQMILNSPSANERDEIDKGQPTRYKFLKELHVDTLMHKHFFIIETTYSGEVAQSRNYFIENSERGLHVRVYMYFNNKWEMKRDTILPKLNLASEVENYKINTNRDGVNSTDVILTNFNSSKIRSIYYLAGSIPENDEVIRITKF